MMPKPFSYEIKEKRLLRSDTYTILFLNEPLCIFSMQEDTVDAYVKNLNAAFDLGVAVGTSPEHQKIAAQHGVVSDNPYKFVVDEDFDDFGFPLISMHIRMPDSTLTSLDHLSVEAAKLFVILMNKAHTMGVAHGMVENYAVSPEQQP